MMSWPQQVRHVFLKDVRATRWLLLGYAALLVLGIIEVAFQFENGAVPQGTLLLRAVAVAICASAVLADSPFNPRAHWATLPYARSAVLVAKLVMVGTLLIGTGVALVGAFVAFEVPLSETLRPTGLSLLGLFAVLLATVLIASVERSFVAVVLVMVASVPALFIFGAVVAALFNTVLDTQEIRDSVTYAALASAALIVLQLFRARRVPKPLRLAVLCAAIVLVGVQLATMDGFAATERGPASTVAVSSELVRRGGGQAPTDETVVMQMALRGVGPSQRVQWVETSVRFNNSAELIKRFIYKQPLNDPPLPLPPGLTWLGASPMRDGGEVDTDTVRRLGATTAITLRTSPVHGRTRVLTDFGDTTVVNATNVAVRGTVELSEPRVFARLPLTTNARFSHHGRRITLLDASLQPHPEVRLDLESVVKGGRPDLHQYTFVLVNIRRQQAVRMQLTSSQYSRDSWLLAPSISGRVMGVLRPTYYGITPAGWQQLGMTVVQFDGAWLKESELVVIEWDLVGSIPVVAQSRIDSI